MNRSFFNRDTIGADLSAGLVLGIQSIPDGLANGMLALVNPIYGLYGYMLGTFSGAFFTSSAFMSIQATSAMALVVASVPQVIRGDDPNTTLFALAMLTGLFMLGAGLLKLGKLIRFIPNSVMVGFINAVATLIILGQLDDFTGFATSGSNRVVRTIDLFRNLDAIHLPTLTVGVVTIVLILTLEKTSLKALGLVVALLLASLLVPLLGLNSVAVVSDIADIPNSLPRPMLPPLSVFPGLLIPAVALTFVGLMQGAGISQSIPNPDGSYPNPSGDFVGQGLANLVSGLFQGTAVAGSMSATALVVGAGARSRLANISAGVVMAIAIVVFGRFVGMIAMPSLAALLIVIGFRTLRLPQAATVWKTGSVQQAVMVLTFAASLLIPLQFAILFGVGLAVLLYVFQQSNRIQVTEWEIGPGQYPVEVAPPATVPPEEVTILYPNGSLFYAAASVFRQQLPEVDDTSRHAVVILVLRDKTDIGSTFWDVLTRYVEELGRQDSKLILTGVDPEVNAQIARTGVLHTIGPENVYLAEDMLGVALLKAVAAAEGWIAAQSAAPLRGQ
ncbi:MAG: SulP family inorganic anion transporter [Caldilineaceae bacterium]|nr:SulP family inorganic anion transporter [Caldilineaceae bacterium]